MALNYLSNLKKPLRLPGLLMERSIVCLNAVVSIKGANKYLEFQKEGSWPWFLEGEYEEILAQGTNYDLKKLLPIVDRILAHARTEYFSLVSTHNFWIHLWKNRGEDLKEADIISQHLRSIQFTKETIPYLELEDFIKHENRFTPTLMFSSLETILKEKIKKELVDRRLFQKLLEDDTILSKKLLYKNLAFKRNLGRVLDIKEDKLSVIAARVYPRLDFKDFRSLESQFKDLEDMSAFLEKTNMSHQQALVPASTSKLFKEEGFPKNWGRLKLPHKLYWIFQSFQSGYVSLDLLRAMIKENLLPENAGYSIPSYLIFEIIKKEQEETKRNYLFYLVKNSFDKTTFDAIVLTVDVENIPRLYLEASVKTHVDFKKTLGLGKTQELENLKKRILALETRVKGLKKFKGRTRLRLVLK